jgi:hypothetical protein
MNLSRRIEPWSDLAVEERPIDITIDASILVVRCMCISNTMDGFDSAFNVYPLRFRKGTSIESLPVRRIQL